MIKIGYTDTSIVKQISEGEFNSTFASPEITSRLEKFANTVRTIAPRSNDFLYFTIIFLKSAESALIDEHGNLKKVGKENAWGYFDDKWKWHGNVKCHKNNNGDIFPEVELKKAARSWIGRPLCVDHKSDSVDGIRGIILDTYYDEKLKQVVGLCALDKINYPDLARKVQTGVVRYGSMGTGVATSICTECGKAATTAKEYCDHIIKRQAWGEINIGLNPIEYSLVVQPAEPGAILLRCIASISQHNNELSSYGVDVDSLPEKLDDKKANQLDLILNNVCGKDGCSLEQRQRIVKSYLNTHGFTKSAFVKNAQYDRQLIGDLARFEDVFGEKYFENPELYKEFFGDALDVADSVQPASEETLTSGQNASGANTITTKDDHDVSDLTGTESSGMVAGVTEPNPDSFQGDGVGPEHYAFSKMKQDRLKTSSIKEEIMNESRLRKRAALRRRLAYPQGGSEPAIEPSTYKDEGANQKKIREQDDKHMTPHPTSLGGTDGMAPGDKEIKEKQLRAEEALRQKKAYHPAGAATPVEPSTFTSEDYHKYWDTDKHMHQTKSMGGDNGMFPGDDSIKQQQKRAKYEGPALSTKFKQRRGIDGSINKAASCFEVYAGNKLVIAATAGDIFGRDLEKNWEWITSKDYAKTVVAEIRGKGLEHVGRLLTKKAQELPVAPEAGLPTADLGGELPVADGAGAPGELPEELPMDGGEVDDSPKSTIEGSLLEMEKTIEDIRGALGDLGGEKVDVDVNVGEGTDVEGMPEEKMALSRNVFNQLKITLAEAKDSADELALLAETYERYGKLSVAQRRDLRVLSADALTDFASIMGQSKTLVSMAQAISKSLVKTSEYVEVPVKTQAKPVAAKPTVKTESNDLEVKAMEFRKLRRQAMLKKAMEAEETDEAEEKKESEADDETVEKEETKENEAHDGIGMKENAPVAGVAKDTAESIATKSPTGGEHKPAPSKGNSDVKGFDSYKSTPSRQVAETSVTSVKQNKADDMESCADDSSDLKDAADKMEEEVDEHEKEHDEKESDAQDSMTPVQEKLAKAFLAKKAEEERDAYRIRLRRAYDVAMEMQRKGMLAPTRPALDRQVDNMMEFDDKAFESFKRSVASAQAQTKTASDISLNVGITEEVDQTSTKSNRKIDAESLAALWGE